MFTMRDVVRFAKNRHRLWEGLPVRDPWLTTRKFTNVFRVLDRGSQYLVARMNEHEHVEDQLALSYLYRQVNSPASMDELIRRTGFLPGFGEITNSLWYDNVVIPAIAASEGPFLNGAYVIAVLPSDRRPLGLKMKAAFTAAADQLWDTADIVDLEGRVNALRGIHGVGPFLAMQIATDLGYCEGEADQENTFVLPGPGSRRGIREVSSKPFTDVIRGFPVHQLPPLPYSNGRLASWMDIQNVFCEFSKYASMVRRGAPAVSVAYKRGEPFPTKIPSQFVK